jgi:single-strand DNA-binding protein
VSGIGLNRVMVIGTVERDPEMRFTPAGKAVTSFTLGIDEEWNTSEGARKKATEWFNIVAWGPLAETCNDELEAGACVYVEGRLQTRSWEDAQGTRNTLTEIVASDVKRLPGGRPATSRPILEPTDS